MMSRIKWSIFNPVFKKLLKRHGVTRKSIAKNGHVKLSLVYKMTAASHPQTVSVKNVKSLLKGAGMTYVGASTRARSLLDRQVRAERKQIARRAQKKHRAKKKRQAQKKQHEKTKNALTLKKDQVYARTLDERLSKLSQKEKSLDRMKPKNVPQSKRTRHEATDVRREQRVETHIAKSQRSAKAHEKPSYIEPSPTHYSPAELKAALQKAQSEHPVVMFYPDNSKPAPLALAARQAMSEAHLSTKKIANRCFINKRRLHDLFNGTYKTMSNISVVRLADGLNMKPYMLLRYNHYEPEIKEKILSPAARPAEPKSAPQTTKTEPTNSAITKNPVANESSKADVAKAQALISTNPRVARAVAEMSKFSSSDLNLVLAFVNRLTK